MLVKTDSNWDKVTDVVIIGYGLAGAAAAITAREFGAEVLILEKREEENFYSNSSLAAASCIGSSDVKKTVQYLEALSRVVGGEVLWTDLDVIRVAAEYIADNANWIRKLGGNINYVGIASEHSELPGADALERYHYAGAGYRMMLFMYEKVKERKVEVRHKVAAKKLLTNIKGDVVGVRVVTAEGKQQDICALRGVILACGGFEFDERLKLNYIKVYPTYFTGTQTNTGDGIRMAIDVGADLWHMNCCASRVVLKYPELPWGLSVDFGGRGWTRRTLVKVKGRENKNEPAGYMMVDRTGHRFTNENFKAHALYYEFGLFDSWKLEYPRIPCFWIFDQKRMGEGVLVNNLGGAAGPQQLYHWSNDNSVELEKGWIISAKTVKELARKLDIPPDALERTVNTYNRYCDGGNDLAFNRVNTTMVRLDKSPFYGCRLYPGGPNTQGGPRRNPQGRILNTDGDTIKGLYGAGELGSVFGMIYPSGGSNIGECIVSGRLAGENVAREKPRAQGQQKPAR